MNRRSVAGAVAVALVGAAGWAVWFAVASKPQAAGGATQVPTATAPVTRGTVTQRVRIPGTYTYDGRYSIVHQAAPGILTGVAAAGTTVERGGVLYSVDNHSVRLLYGDVPAYRDFDLGMADGPDVRQLEQNLVDLGLDPSRQITVDGHFTTATDAAIRRWQATWGGVRTGTLPLGEVAFAPGPLRVSHVAAVLGAALAPNQPVFEASSTARVVTAEVGADRQGTVKVGDEVIVSLPGGVPVPGTILRIARVATVDDQANNGGQSRPATVTITVGVTPPPGTPDLDQAPVLVSIATNARQNVLLVPVAALLARPGGGYQVRLASGALVEVKPGLFDETTGKVEVTGALTAGDLVEVPAT